jgi:hypothetical protein
MSFPKGFPVALLEQRGQFYGGRVGTRPPDPMVDEGNDRWVNDWPAPWIPLDLADPADLTPGALPVTLEPPLGELGPETGLFHEAHEYRIILPCPLDPAPLGAFTLGWQSTGEAPAVRAVWFHVRPSVLDCDRPGRVLMAMGHSPLVSSFKCWVTSPGALEEIRPYRAFRVVKGE